MSTNNEPSVSSKSSSPSSMSSSSGGTFLGEDLVSSNGTLTARCSSLLQSTTDFVTASTENLSVDNSGRTSAPPYPSDSSVLGPFPPKKMDGRRTFR